MNDIKRYLNKIIVTFLIIVCSFTLQMSIFNHLSLANVTPNILICVVSTYGFTKGQKQGLIVGFLIGLLLDMFSASYFGLYALVYMYIGYINGFFKKLFYGDELRLPLVLIASSDFLYGIFIYLALYFTRQSYNFKFFLQNVILPEVIYTVIVSIFVYYIILHINTYMDKLEKKGSDRFGTY